MTDNGVFFQQSNSKIMQMLNFDFVDDLRSSTVECGVLLVDCKIYFWIASLMYWFEQNQKFVRNEVDETGIVIVCH